MRIVLQSIAAQKRRGRKIVSIADDNHIALCAVRAVTLIVGGHGVCDEARGTVMIVAVTGLANPKSISFAPDLVSMMLPSFQSLWMMPSW
nr:hypothetical protein [Edaphobacter aggregans]